MPERVLFAGGGTGGHVYMAVAIRQELSRQRPERRFLFVGTERGLETKILPPLNFELRTIRLGGLNRVGLKKAMTTSLQIPFSLIQSWNIIRHFGPDVVVGLGGYSSGPVVAAARLAGRATVIVEPNVVPGFTNRLLRRWVDAAAVAFEETRRWFPGKVRVTGIPVRPEFHQIAPATRSPLLHILVFGGSRGSRPLNDLICRSLSSLPAEKLSIVHQTGPEDLERVKSAYASLEREAEVVDYITDMPARFSRADLIVARAGASTVAEITAAGRPAILIPFPQAADDHQRKNAQALADRDAALVMEQESTSGRELAAAILLLERNRDRLAKMSSASRSLARADSTAQIVALIEETARSRR